MNSLIDLCGSLSTLCHQQQQVKKWLSLGDCAATEGHCVTCASQYVFMHECRLLKNKRGGMKPTIRFSLIVTPPDSLLSVIVPQSLCTPSWSVWCWLMSDVSLLTVPQRLTLDTWAHWADTAVPNALLCGSTWTCVAAGSHSVEFLLFYKALLSGLQYHTVVTTDPARHPSLMISNCSLLW